VTPGSWSLSGATKRLGFAGFAHMTVRSMLLRWVVWGCCLVGVLLGAREAQAAAPMCDDRGASAIAPSPVLPVRDVKLEAGVPTGCETLLRMSVAPAGPSARGQAVVSGDSFDEAWLKPSLTKVSRLSSARAPGGVVASLPPSAGYRHGVFRPPRV
jgi:hypothetical protein